MLANYIIEKIKSNFSYEPTPSQHNVITGMASLLTSEAVRPVMIINGYAGSGKTALMASFCAVAQELEVALTLMAPTGRAAKVLSGFTGLPAHTIHKSIYRQDVAMDYNSGFSLNFNRDAGAVFIVDEASMISNAPTGETDFGTGRLLEDLLDFVFSRKNCKLILMGDSAQLPPVGSDIGPALDENYLRQYGVDVQSFFLTDVVRQQQESGILKNSLLLRQLIFQDPPVAGYPKFDLKNAPDVERIGGADLIETLSGCYDRYGVENTLVVTRSNKRANQYNQGIRNTVFYKEEAITRGDYLMVMKNNYYWLREEKKGDFIANGDIAEIARINGYAELYGHRFADVSLCFVDQENREVDVKILMDTINSDLPKLTHQEEEQFYRTVMEDYQDLTSARKKLESIRENQWYNALQVKFAYALTCHKAQGGQWDAVFVDLGYITEEMLDVNFYKWLYTAITRAGTKLYLVNFKEEFFE
ncbi:MAG: AAA family ATPase [Breznakibacter sp.]|nr:AAA family ATPase [Breznakibacter sp.]